ncbi:hypothetical protein Poli38472_001954 [Pythium oligandrum]|uniref:Uncharacterized protein n=1 Tax=Pythium oligandrum TaxID=41045 RepID=A0A8K1CVP1_PYTOL|nr:hypothetical protein Poli38472_001954 [Pythium oligandrum]|eukprot:TMW69798.1 hypothetical protein Poli38472_001954 [Pythium oligandrum]
MQASLTDAADIARKEYVSSDDASGSAVKSWASRNDSSRPTHSDSLYTIGSYGSFSSTSSSLVDLHVESVEDWEQAQTNPHGTVYSQSPVTADEYQTQLLRKMEQLRLTAEQTYQLAKKNEGAHAWLVDTL